MKMLKHEKEIKKKKKRKTIMRLKNDKQNILKNEYDKMAVLKKYNTNKICFLIRLHLMSVGILKFILREMEILN